MEQINSNNPKFEIKNEFIEVQVVPGVYDLIEVKYTIKQRITDSGYELVDMSKFKKKFLQFLVLNST